MRLLPNSWVEEIFARLTLRYGVAFKAQYADLDPIEVMADWAVELGGFRDKPWAIKAALENLPADKPPNAAQFRLLCNAARPAIVASLPEPKADPARVQKALSQARDGVVRDPRTEAQKVLDGLIERSKVRPLSRAQKDFIRVCVKALRHGDERLLVFEKMGLVAVDDGKWHEE